MRTVTCPNCRPGRHSSQTDLNRREFLGSFLTVLLFWRRKRRKLAGIEFQRIRHGREPRRYLLIHGNEQTAREVLIEHMRTAHGTAYLVLNTTRNVPFHSGVLDPNRMFSREGAEKNLRTLNPDWNDAQLADALAILDRKRHEILKAVRPKHGDVTIALHNNQDYSVNDELENSNRTALNDKDNPHDFCLCTNPRDFDLLAAGPYNVVLQSAPLGADDGSLSRYAARAGLRYANIESALSRLDKQRAMLEFVDRALPRA